MTSFAGGESFAIPIFEVSYADLRYEAKITPYDLYLPRGGVRQMLTAEASIEIEGRLTSYGAWWAKLALEELDRREWIAGIKQRLGLMQIGDLP